MPPDDCHARQRRPSLTRRTWRTSNVAHAAYVWGDNTLAACTVSRLLHRHHPSSSVRWWAQDQQDDLHARACLDTYEDNLCVHHFHRPLLSCRRLRRDRRPVWQRRVQDVFSAQPARSGDSEHSRCPALLQRAEDPVHVFDYAVLATVLATRPPPVVTLSTPPST
ncbi:hypothetical protein BV25DRAFT_1922244 [Artomyces pyxidatus]|uniref:Uncharacterized protein n=1 Tax=Artomyces pyxidatus TaxID=48021 RepID=A0ACB8SG75_9AGAM|nr:hypothetical protein BV25DRAFT_1922244 [Artomyces pyxidatus]